MPLGNDVVDLREARALRKESDPRFLSRVFSPSEQVCIAHAKDPALAHWMIWSAKESMFKVAAQTNPNAIFAHTQFSLESELLALLESCSGGSLTAGKLHWEWNEEYVHCVCGQASRSGVERTKIREDRLSDEEEASVHSAESRQVRRLAKKLIGEEKKIIRKWNGEKFLPPEASGFEISLSHDGRFVAAVVNRSRDW